MDYVADYGRKYLSEGDSLYAGPGGKLYEQEVLQLMGQHSVAFYEPGPGEQCGNGRLSALLKLWQADGLLLISAVVESSH